MPQGPIQAVQNQVQTHVVAQAHAGLQGHAVSPTRKKVALVLAALADLVQLGFFPIFGEGALSIPDDVLDLIVAVALFITLGFKLRVLLALAIELVPGLALFPSWTAVVATLPTYEVKKVKTEVVKPQPAKLPETTPENMPETDAYSG
jgi:hypothetical protein